MRNQQRKNNLNETRKEGFNSNEKSESSEHLDRLPTERDEHRCEIKIEEKTVGGETEETVIKENSINAEEINIANIVEKEPDSKDVDEGEFKVVVSRKRKSKKQNKKQSSPSKQTFKTEKIGNESLLQNQFGRFKSSEQRRTYSENYCQQKRDLNKVSNRKGSFFTGSKNKCSNLSKNSVHASVQYSTSHSSSNIQNNHGELDEASVKIYISTSAKKLSASTAKVFNSGESVSETTSVQSSTSTAEILNSGESSPESTSVKSSTTKILNSGESSPESTSVKSSTTKILNSGESVAETTSVQSRTSTAEILNSGESVAETTSVQSRTSTAEILNSGESIAKNTSVKSSTDEILKSGESVAETTSVKSSSSSTKIFNSGESVAETSVQSNTSTAEILNFGESVVETITVQSSASTSKILNSGKSVAETISVQSSTSKILNSGESVAETTSVKSNTKALKKHFRSKKQRNSQLKNKDSSPNVSKATIVEQKINDSTTCIKQHTFSDTVDKLEQKRDNVIKPKQYNSQDEVAVNVDCEDILKHETVQQSQLNVNAKEFSPLDNQSIYCIKKPKERRKKMATSNCSNVECRNDKMEYQQKDAESLNLIQETESIEINTGHISTTCENSTNARVPKIPEHQFDQSLTFEPQFQGLPEMPEQSFYNEAQGYHEYDNEIIYSRNSDQGQFNDLALNFIPEPVTGTNQNYYNVSDISTPNLNVRNQTPMIHYNYNGTTYFYPSQYLNFGDYYMFNFLHQQRMNFRYV